MLTLPDAIVSLLIPFATLFHSPTWRKAQILLVGAILVPGQRTVAAARRVMGRSDQRDYARYHEVQSGSVVLNRAVWCSIGQCGAQSGGVVLNRAVWCSIGRCGRPARRLAPCCCGCSSTWIGAMVR